MPIIINGTTLGSSASINGTSLNTIKFNGTIVWEGLPSWNNNGLEYNSWETIQTYIKAGKIAEKISVGATKTFLLRNKTYTAEVVSINSGTGSASSWYPANTVDFICKELYEELFVYVSYSSQDNSGGFPYAQIRTNINNMIYPKLPTDLKNVIIAKSHSYQSGVYSSRGWNSNMTTTSDKLWLPTYYEIMGETNSAAIGETSSNNKAYTLASKVKMQNGNTSAMIWWLGSPYCANYYGAWGITKDGMALMQVISSDLGVPICFRIG